MKPGYPYNQTILSIKAIACDGKSLNSVIPLVIDFQPLKSFIDRFDFSPTRHYPENFVGVFHLS